MGGHAERKITTLGLCLALTVVGCSDVGADRQNGASPAGASPARPAPGPATSPDLPRGADVVIAGSVEDVRSEWEGGRIATTARVRVRATLRGSAEPTVEVKASGGTVGGIAMVVSGGAVLRSGDESVLFLSARGPQEPYRIVGGARGKLTISRDDAGNPAVRLPASDGSEAHAVSFSELGRRLASQSPTESR